MSGRTFSDEELSGVIAGYSTRQLAEALARRPDLDSLVQADGRVSGAIWPLRTKLGSVACVDGVIVRRNKQTGALEGGVIRRRTGRFPGKLAIVGGVVGFNQSLEDALKFHFKSDLGLDVKLPMGWDRPVLMRQYAPQVDGLNRPDFCWDPGKHSYASTHIVICENGRDEEVVLGTKSGDNEAEASSLEWYDEKNIPPESEWSYDMRDTFCHVMVCAFNRYSGVKELS